MALSAEERNRRIEYRLRRARLALDCALDELRTAMERVQHHRRRISRLERVLKIAPEERAARAQKAVATKKRRAVPEHLRRGLRVQEDE